MAETKKERLDNVLSSIMQVGQIKACAIVSKEGFKHAKKEMVTKFVSENPEFIQTGEMPEGWVKVAQAGHVTYSAPNKYIASQLKPLVDDGWMDIAMGEETKLGKAYSIMQVMKEMRLSGDFFLEQRLIMQKFANRRFGIDAARDMFTGVKKAKLESPEFLKREDIAVKDGLITPMVSKIAGGEERLASTLKGTGFIGKIAKATLKAEEKRMDMFYLKMQRKIKVNDYWSKREAWKGRHPGYT